MNKKSLRQLAEEGDAYVENERTARAIEEKLGETTVEGTKVPNTAAAGMLSMLMGNPQLGARLLAPHIHAHAEKALAKKVEKTDGEDDPPLTETP